MIFNVIKAPCPTVYYGTSWRATGQQPHGAH